MRAARSEQEAGSNLTVASGLAEAMVPCLAVIPARGGSKRIPGKNIRPLAGKPMIAFTIEAALESGVFADVIVSTDDDGIAGIARAYGAEVPFMRAASLADDQTHVSAVTVDVIERLDPGCSRYEAVAQLMANCPLRTADDIRASYDRFNQSGALSQMSVTRYGWFNPWWAMAMDAKGELTPLNPAVMTSRSQDLPVALCPTGAIWWARTDVLRREKTFHINGRTGWEMPWQRAVDIDDEEDFRMAELLMKARLTGEDT